MNIMNKRELTIFLARSNNQKLLIIDNMFRKAFRHKDSREVLRLFNKVSYEEIGLSLENYKKYLRSITQLLLEENDQGAYCEGIKVLKKCYREIHQRVSYTTLVDAFAKRVYEVENNEVGFASWMKDAVEDGVITQTQYKRILTQYKVNLKKDEKTM